MNEGLSAADIMAMTRDGGNGNSTACQGFRTADTCTVRIAFLLQAPCSICKDRSICLCCAEIGDNGCCAA